MYGIMRVESVDELCKRYNFETLESDGVYDDRQKKVTETRSIFFLL